MLACQKEKFNIPEDIRYLNCAFMSPLMESIERRGKTGIELKRNPFGVGLDDFFQPAEDLRREFALLINCNKKDQIVIIPSVSYGMANITKNIKLTSGANIILAGEQFPSNVYPWYRMANEQSAEVKIVAPPDTSEERGGKWNELIMESIDDKTELVAISQCHWADGTLFDLQSIRAKTHEVGALLILDGTQSIGAFPFDVQEIEPDALICAGYKWLLGPYSIGLAYYGPRFNEGIPVEENWINRLKSEDFAGLVDYEETYQPGALRYEVGEHSNFIMVPMLIEGIRQINTWGTENIQSYCKEISSSAIREMQNAGFWIENENHRGHHLFGIRLPDSLGMEEVKAELDQKKIFVSIRGSSIRVAPHVYNTREEMDLLAEVLVQSVLREKV